MRKKYCWLAGTGGWCWFCVREKYYWLVAAKHRVSSALVYVLIMDLA